jgi:hypothetical protein
MSSLWLLEQITETASSQYEAPIKTLLCRNETEIINNNYYVEMTVCILLLSSLVLKTWLFRLSNYIN